MKQGMWAGGLVVGVLLALGPAAPTVGAAGLQAKIDQAMDLGLKYLKSMQTARGIWSYSGLGNEGDKMSDVGSTALAGLTLLECGVPAKNRAVQRAAAAIREQTVKLKWTYSLSLAVMFLDRLGDPGDVALIESMVVRLLAGQSREGGGWGYVCPEISPAEMTRLTSHIKERNELVARGKLPKTLSGKRRTVNDLPKEIRDQLVLVARQGAFRPESQDNSNTQFATMALWIGRRHGLPVHEALARVETRFRSTQYRNGFWGYVAETGGMGTFSASMTCAGLLGLAIGSGSFNEQMALRNPKKKVVRNPDKDPSIRAGLVALASCIGNPKALRGSLMPFGVPQIGNDLENRTYYTLWSLERVAMVYGLDKLGKKDWHAWGSQLLIDTQQTDGSWKGSYAKGGVDTCFALLFLCRSNLAADLTANLRGKIRNAGESTLKSGVRLPDTIRNKDSIKPLPSRDKPAPKDKPARGKEDDQDAEIARLSTALVRARAAQQNALLTQLRDTKGVVYTEALASAIPMLKGGIKDRARAALATRFTRMSAATLRDKFQDDNLEVRRAAILACAKKESKQHIPDLINLLEDSELPVALAAHRALKGLTGKDFGPAADATRAERKAAVAQWKAWWKQNKQEE